MLKCWSYSYSICLSVVVMSQFKTHLLCNVRDRSKQCFLQATSHWLEWVLTVTFLAGNSEAFTLINVYITVVQSTFKARTRRRHKVLYTVQFFSSNATVASWHGLPRRDMWEAISLILNHTLQLSYFVYFFKIKVHATAKFTLRHDCKGIKTCHWCDEFKASDQNFWC